jgi:mono/diheme cytochrome c family protein
MRTPMTSLTLSLMLATLACGRKDAEPPAQAGGEPAAAGAPGTELSPFELKNGIGPVTSELTLGALDHEMAERGEKTFTAKCSACHKFDEKYVGPALGGVLERRTPTYVMNMILNPEGMYTRHPVAKQLLAENLTQMPNLGLSQTEAREVVEYFRDQAAKSAKK